MGKPGLVRSPSRRFTRENASPSFHPLTTLDKWSRNCLGCPKPKVAEKVWKNVSCDVVNISHPQILGMQISGLPCRETVILMISTASPNLTINIPDQPSDPPVLLDLMNGDEFSVRTSGSGTFTVNLFSTSMKIKFQREFAIIDHRTSKQVYSNAIQKAKNEKHFPELIVYTNDPSNQIQAVTLSPKGFSGFGKNKRIFFTYWNAIHDILRNKYILDIQLYTGESARFVSRHAKFIARCVKHYRSRYKHTSKAPDPIVDAFQILHDFGF